MMPPTDEEALITEAITLAREAEVVVLVLGMNNDWGREGVDRSTLSLPCRTEDLIHAVCAANPNTVIVNQSACAVDMSWTDKPAAVIQAWYQGQENGNAIADVLLGLANPSGKLPITFPRAIEDHGSAKWFPGDLDNDYVEYGEYGRRGGRAGLCFVITIVRACRLHCRDQRRSVGIIDSILTEDLNINK